MIIGPSHGAAPSHSDLTKAAQNPIADLISVPFQNNTSFKYGPQEKTQNIFNIQPVYPISLGERAKIEKPMVNRVGR